MLLLRDIALIPDQRQGMLKEMEGRREASGSSAGANVNNRTIKGPAPHDNRFFCSIQYSKFSAVLKR